MSALALAPTSHQPVAATPPTVHARVLVAADHPLARAGLLRLLERDPDLELAAEASSPEQAAALAAELQPQVAVVDLGEDGGDGVEAARLISARAPGTGVLLLTVDHGIERFVGALRAGARGVVLESAPEQEILDAVRAVRGGQVILGPAIAERLVALVAGSDTPSLQPFPGLSKREREVLELLAGGAGNGLIAQRLFLSPKTVRNHVSSICNKLGAADRLQAALRAREAGLGAPAR